MNRLKTAKEKSHIAPIWAVAVFFCLSGLSAAGQEPAPKPAAPPTSAPTLAPSRKLDAAAPNSPPANPPAVVDPRQAQILADTRKLLKLSQELQAEVAKSSKDTLSLTVIKKAEEVEKLAKTLRDEIGKSR